MIGAGRGTFVSKEANMGLGRHKVTWEYEPCVESGLFGKESVVLLTLCKREEFTCE